MTALNKLFGGKADLSNIWGGIPSDGRSRQPARPAAYISRCSGRCFSCPFGLLCDNCAAGHPLRMPTTTLTSHARVLAAYMHKRAHWAVGAFVDSASIHTGHAQLLTLPLNAGRTTWTAWQRRAGWWRPWTRSCADEMVRLHSPSPSCKPHRASCRLSRMPSSSSCWLPRRCPAPNHGDLGQHGIWYLTLSWLMAPAVKDPLGTGHGNASQHTPKLCPR